MLSFFDFERNPVIPLPARAVADLPQPPAAGPGADSRTLAYRTVPELNGQLIVDPEIILPSIGMNVDIAYFYNSNNPTNGAFGYGRTLSTNLLAQASGSPLIATLTRGNGGIATYQHDGSGSFGPSHFFSATQDNRNTFERVGSGPGAVWKETVPNGRSTVYPADTTGVVTSISYAEEAVGNRHTFAYSAGLLESLQDAVGRRVTFAYNSGLLETIRDWAGRVTSFVYDTTTVAGKPLLATVIGPTGCQTGYGYDADTRLTRITSPNGFDTTYSYDPYGRVAQSTVGGGTTLYEYGGAVTTVTKPDGGVTTNTMDANWNLLSIESPIGALTTFTRDFRGRETERLDALGGSSVTEYYGSGIPSATENALDQRTEILIDANGEVSRITQPDFNQMNYVWGYGGSPYDPTGEKHRLQAQSDQLGRRTSYSYDGRGQRIGMQDALGQLTSYNYDALGNMQSVVSPLNLVTSFSYDLAGNVTEVQDALGNRTTRLYDAQNRVTEIVNPLGARTTLGYDSVGNLSIYIDALGGRTSLTYNAFDKPVSVTDPLGNITTTVYDTQGRPIASIDALGFRTSVTYDLAGRLVAQTNALNQVATLVYDIGGRVIATIDALGNITSTTYDLLDQPIAVMNALGFMATIAYDVMNRPVELVDALGNRVTASYDATGLPVGQMDQLGFRATLTYDRLNRPTARIDALGRITTLEYDAGSRLRATVDALGNRWTNSYDAVGRPIAQTDPLARISTAVYDALGRLTASVDPLNSRTSYLYDALNRQIRVLDGAARQTSYSYDAAGRLQKVSSNQVVFPGFLLNTTTYSYDPVGRQIESQDTPGYLHTMVYDAVGRMIATVEPLGPVATLTFGVNTRTSWLYDAAGRQAASMDAMGRINTNLYDAAGQLLAQQNPLGFFTSFAYDAVGRNTAVIDARSHIVTSLFDPRGSLLAMQDPLGALTSYAYDAVGNGTLRTDARGIATTMSYDALDRNTGLAYPSGRLVTYAFDAAGQQTLMADLTGLTSYTYDGAGRPKSVIYPTGLSLTQSYDPVGRRTSLREAAGAITTYSYQLASVGPFLMIDPQGLSTQLNTQSSLTPRLGHIGNLISPVSYSFSQRFAYAGNGQAFRQRNTRMNQPNEDLNITYDTVGRIFTTGEAGASRRYGYDAAGQLTNDLYVSPALFNLTYSYDPTGNRLTQLDGAARTTYVYDAANQLQTEKLGAAITTYSYDQNGNRASQVTGAAITSFTWDEENRLTGIAYPDATRATYLYSADGLRQRKIDSTGTINYLWDEGRVQQELNENLVEIVRYTQSIWGLDSLISQYRGGVTSFFGYDLAGNTRQLVDLAGNVTDTYIYETFGVVRTRTGTTINNFEFGGQWGYIHDLFGLSRAGLRIVDSKTGQWLSRDPIGLWGGGANLLTYVGNDPVSEVDPWGLAEYDIVPYRPTAPGFQNHHGVNDVWAKLLPGYVKKTSPTIQLRPENHGEMNELFPPFYKSLRQQQGSPRVNWNNVTPQQIFELSERQFDRGQVPGWVRSRYYRAFNSYNYTGTWDLPPADPIAESLVQGCPVRPLVSMEPPTPIMEPSTPILEQIGPVLGPLGLLLSVIDAYAVGNGDPFAPYTRDYYSKMPPAAKA